MSTDPKDNDVIVLSEEDVSYDTPIDAGAEENVSADPAEGDLAASDPAAQAGPGTTTPASTSYGDSDQPPGRSGPLNASGSAIPMPGASAAPAAAATSAGATNAGATAAATSGTTSDSNWPQIQSLFVDDPRAAVQQAADVAGGALAALVAAANNREQTLRDHWQGGSAGTEDLRTALRDYRDLAGRLATLSRDL